LIYPKLLDIKNSEKVIKKSIETLSDNSGKLRKYVVSECQIWIENSETYIRLKIQNKGTGRFRLRARSIFIIEETFPKIFYPDSDETLSNGLTESYCDSASSEVCQFTPWQIIQETVIELDVPNVIFWFFDPVDPEKSSSTAEFFQKSQKALVLRSTDLKYINSEIAAYKFKITTVIFDFNALGLNIERSQMAEICHLAELFRDGGYKTLGRVKVMIYASCGLILSFNNNIDRWVTFISSHCHDVGHVIHGTLFPREIINYMLVDTLKYTMILTYREFLTAISPYLPEENIYKTYQNPIEITQIYLWSYFGSVEELTMEINGSIKYIDSQQIGNLILLQREKTEERRKMYENWKEKRSSSKQQLLETQMMAINIVRQSHGLA